jgi:acetyltransferase-like isoleucine patch superfamily enzyme
MFNRKFFLSKIRNSGSGNVVQLPDTLKNIKIKIKVKGDNNTIRIEDLGDCWKGSELNISLRANNSTIVIDKGFMLRDKLDILCNSVHAQYGVLSNSSIKIGKNTSIVSGEICVQNSNVNVNIGDDCMFSRNVLIYATDGHPIYDKKTGNLINRVSDLKIGNKCWISQNVTILKNVTLNDFTIVGASSVVSKSTTVPNSILAGNPARTVKDDVEWSRGSVEYIENN